MNALADLDEAARQAPRSVVEATTRVLKRCEQPAQAAFLARALRAVAQMLDGLDERTLGDVAGAPSDYEAILRALEEPAALAILRDADILAPARLRGVRERVRLLDSEGGSLTAAAVAMLLGITRQAVDKRRRTGHLLGLATGRRGYLYPSWQFGAQSTVPGLEPVLADLRGHDPWMQAAFFLSGNLRLGGDTPLAELRRGHLEDVRRAAQAYGEQGAA